jgi:hypothetical protein
MVCAATSASLTLNIYFVRCALGVASDLGGYSQSHPRAVSLHEPCVHEPLFWPVLASAQQEVPMVPQFTHRMSP